MPKEIVYSAGAVSDDEAGYHAKVGWSAERQVQIGVEANGARSLFWLLTGCDGDQPGRDDSLARLGDTIDAALAEWEPANAYYRAQAILNALDVYTNGQNTGVWLDLDRQGCNRLIRALRKARDSAYGRDE